MSDANYEGPALLKEQTDLLSESTPSDINFLHFLKLRLTAQQRATAQRNYWQRVQQQQQQQDGPGAPASTSATPVMHASGAIPTYSPATRPAAASWNVHTTPPHTHAAIPPHGSRSPLADSSVHSASVLSRPDTFSASNTLQSSQTPVAVVEGRSAAFEQLPASAAHRAQTRDSSILPSPASFVLEGRGATLDEKPAMASGMPQLPAGADDVKDVALEPCPHCGRTFAPDRLQRHATTCARQQTTHPRAKAEGKDRKASGGSASSGVRSERAAAAAASTTSSASTKQGNAPAGGGGAGTPSTAAKTEKWRRQSAQLRNALAGTSAAAV